MLKKFTPAERGWIMYDWANSAFSAIIAAIILPNFYGTLTQGNLVAGTWWGYATSIGTLICALLAPFLGTLGDYKGWKKRLFTAFVLLGVITTAGLTFTMDWKVMLVLYILGTVRAPGALCYTVLCAIPAQLGAFLCLFVSHNFLLSFHNSPGVISTPRPR